MTYRLDVARGRNIVARWCKLAEQRLEYLTELSETGRWRRFHSEPDIVENIRGSEDRGGDLARSAHARGVTGQFRRRHVLAEPRQNHPAARRNAGLFSASASAATIADAGRAAAARYSHTAVKFVDVFSDQALSVRRPGLQSGLTAALDPAANDAAGLAPDVAAIQQRYPSLRHGL